MPPFGITTRITTRSHYLPGELERIDGSAELFDLQPAPFATPEDAELAHDSDYVYAFVNGTLARSAFRRIGFPYSEFLVRRTMASQS